LAAANEAESSTLLGVSRMSDVQRGRASIGLRMKVEDSQRTADIVLIQTEGKSDGVAMNRSSSLYLGEEQTWNMANRTDQSYVWRSILQILDILRNSSSVL